MSSHIGPYSNVASGTRSLANVNDAEWCYRKINLLALLRGFVGQLTPGQDLTKVSLPSVLCHPFSMLEIMSQRILLTFHVLFEMEKLEDPLARFMVVVKWLISVMREEILHKKPFNPVVGETHLCWIENGPDDFTEYYSEQVSHHPPIAAIFTRAIKHEITAAVNPTFGVKFGSNYAAITTSGGVTLHFGKEVYEISKLIPDAVVHNVVKGKRYMTWEGEVTITCPDTGYTCSYVYKEDKQCKEKVKPTIFSGKVSRLENLDEPIYLLDGQCSKYAYIWPPSKNEVPVESKIELYNYGKLQESFIMYLPDELRDELSSEVVWGKVAKAIVVDDMPTADTEKKLVEEKQRKREAKKKADGLADEGTYFSKDPTSLEGFWAFKNNVDLIQWLKLSSSKKSEKVDIEDSTGAELPHTPTKEMKKSNEIPAGSPDILPEISLSKPNVNSSTTTSTITSTTSSAATITTTTTGTTIVIPSSVPVITSSTTATTTTSTISTTPTSANGAITPPAQQEEQITAGAYASDDEWQYESSDEPSDDEIQDEHHSNQPVTSSGNVMATPGSTSGGANKDQMLTKKSGSFSTATSSASKKDSHKVRREKKRALKKEKKVIVARGKEQQQQKRTSTTQSLIPEKDILKSGTVKIRNSFKKWNVRFAILIEGKLVYYKSKSDVQRDICAGIVLLQSCLVKQRPSKKAGFCIKIFSVYQNSIFSRQDFRGKPLRKVLPAAHDYCLIRLPDHIGKEWLQALQQAIPDYDECKKLAPDHTDSISSSDSVEGNSSGNEDNFQANSVTIPASGLSITQIDNGSNLSPSNSQNPEKNLDENGTVTIPSTTNVITTTVQIPNDSSTTPTTSTATTTITSTVSLPVTINSNVTTVGTTSTTPTTTVNIKDSVGPLTPRISRNAGATGFMVPSNTELREIREELKFLHDQVVKLQANMSRALEWNSGAGELQEKNALRNLSNVEGKLLEQISRSEAKLAFTVRSAVATARASNDSANNEQIQSKPRITTELFVGFFVGLLFFWILRFIY